ncbi:MAG: YncE family protein [Acidobacteria bacterium]|nr:YncE family protein [Acidobacteriota bacterium]
MNKRFHSRYRGALSLLTLILFATAACGGAEPADSAPAAAPVAAETAASEPELLYVASQSGPALSVIDMNAREVVETIWLTDLGFTANAKPHHVAVEPDGSFWYASLIADGRVLKFNRDNELVGQAEFETPGLMAVDPVADVLYVGRSMAAANPPQRIGLITRSDMAIDEYDVFLPRPHAIAVAPGGGRVFTASLAVNQIASVSPEEDDLEIVNVDGDPHTFVQFVVSPDGSRLVTGGQISGEVMVFDVTDPRIPELLTSFQIGGQPWHPVYSPDGRFVYFPQRTSNSVAVVEAETWEVVASIEGDGLAEPHGSAISADGRTLWISGRNTEAVYPTTIERTSTMSTAGEALPAGTVVAIDTETRQIVAVIEVPAYAAGISTRPH